MEKVRGEGDGTGSPSSSLSASELEMRDPAIVPVKFDKILKRGRARDPRHCSSFCSHNGREVPVEGTTEKRPGW